MYRVLGVLIGLSLILSACSTQPLTVRLTASKQLNPSRTNQSLPVEVKLYQLKTADTFNTLTLNQLLTDDLAVLNGSVLLSRSVIVAPAQHKTVHWRRHPQAQYLAIVVLFQQTKGNDWRRIEKLPPVVQTDILPLGFKIAKQQVDID